MFGGFLFLTSKRTSFEHKDLGWFQWYQMKHRGKADQFVAQNTGKTTNEPVTTQIWWEGLSPAKAEEGRIILHSTSKNQDPPEENTPAEEETVAQQTPPKREGNKAK